MVDAVDIAQPRILVVDDSRTMRKAIRRILTKDYDIIEADDGDVAWDIILEDSSISLVFADLMMPNMNGFQLLRNIRESSDTHISQLPVIILTGHNDEDKMRGKAFALGATDFATKPFESVELQARAKSNISAASTRKDLRKATDVLEKKTTIDPLTGLPNRRYFLEHGKEAMAFCVRQGAPISIMRLSIDKYEVLFKRRGKALAEKVLLNSAKIIGNIVRREDTVARIGLSEFAVVMPGTDAESARLCAERIHAIMQKTGYRMGNSRFRMTVSAGLVSPALGKNISFDDVIKQVNERLKQAVKEGGDRVVESAMSFDDDGTITLTVDEALVALRSGATEQLDLQLLWLMERMYPLLQYANKQLGLGLEGSMLQLKERLDSLKRKAS